jgi:hypothetical protein
MDTPIMISIATLVLTSAGMIWTYFYGISKVKKELSVDINELWKLSTEQGTRLTRLETKADIFWANISSSVSQMIKQPIHYRKDELMDKLVPGHEKQLKVATVEELLELKVILKEELTSLQEMKEPKSLAYALAIAYIDQILYDKGLLKGERQ